ncbi:hypothetical protein CCACVL1_01548, partial [Corchorus capsularis]
DVDHCPSGLQGVGVVRNRNFNPFKERPRKRRTGSVKRELAKELVNGV